ncbi:MAG: MFS transporter [Acidimicrobiia bacterium]|nr:MFS transporter [Acidimicrobiia bacterium]
MGKERAFGAAIEAPGAEEVSILPWPALFRRRLTRRIESSDRYQWWVLWTVLAGLFSVGFTITILAISLPRIATDLHSDTTTLTWVITGPLLAFGVVAPLLGKAGDIWGQKRLFMLALSLTLVFAGLTAAAWSASSLILFRVLGAGEGAATGPASMALIMMVFRPEDRVKAMGFWSLVGAGAPVLGVVAGGPIVEHLSWRLIYIAQIPFTALALLAAALILPGRDRVQPDRRREPLDVAGVITVGLGTASLLFALNRGPEWGWTSPGVVVAFLLSPLMLAAFIAVERRSRAPLIPLAYFRRRNFAFPIGVQFFSNFAYMGSFILTPLFLKEAFHYGETKIGLLSIARPLSFSLTAPVAGYLAVRWGERLAAIAGCAFVVASMLAWSQVEPGASNWAVMGALALAGVGLGVSSPSMASSVANAVEEENLGIAGAAQQLLTQVGIVAGIQLAETVQAARQPVVGLVQSFQDSYLLAGAACMLGLICGLFVRSAERGEREPSAAALLREAA